MLCINQHLWTMSNAFATVYFLSLMTVGNKNTTDHVSSGPMEKNILTDRTLDFNKYMY